MCRLLIITAFSVAVLGLVCLPAAAPAERGIIAGDKEITPQVITGTMPPSGEVPASKPADGLPGLPLRNGSLPEGVKALTRADMQALERTPGDPLYVDGDILVEGTEFFDVSPSMASDSHGNLYCAYEVQDTSSVRIHISRSTDSGMTWQFWTMAWAGVDLTQPAIAVGEDSGQDFLVLAFVHDGTGLDILRWTLDMTYADGAILEYNILGVCNPQIVTDATEYATWYPYVVYNSRGVDSWLLRFSRSTDYGATWSAPATLYAYSGYPDPVYNGYDAYPDVEFGSGYLCVALDNYPSGGDGSHRDVYFIQSGDFGSSWSSAVAIASTSYDEFAPRLAAVKWFSGQRTVVAGYTKYYGGLDWDIWFSYTQDGGGTWYTNYCLACASDRLEAMCDLATSYSQGRMHMAFYDNGTVRYSYAPCDNPVAWAVHQDVSDPNVASLAWPRPAVAVDLTRPLYAEAGISWTDERSYDRQIYFDGPITTNAGVEPIAEVAAGPMEIACLPNPFGSSTTVSFSLARPGPVTAAVYDASGRLVRSLADGTCLEPGEKRITWDGLDGAGHTAGPGVYFVRVTTPGGSSRSKVVVVK